MKISVKSINCVLFLILFALVYFTYQTQFQNKVKNQETLENSFMVQGFERIRKVENNLENLNETIKNPETLQNLVNNENFDISLEEMKIKLQNEDILKRIKSMMNSAWENYAMHAWGQNELNPVDSTKVNSHQFPLPFGLTLIESLDTLFIMGMTQEFIRGVNWIKENFTTTNMYNTSISELTSRVLGGLLSAYSLSQEKILLTKAEELGNFILKAFVTNRSIPYSSVYDVTRQKLTIADEIMPVYLDCVFLSEVGSFHLEFSYLSELTGNSIYKEKASNIRAYLKTIRDNHIFKYVLPQYINRVKPVPCSNDFDLGKYSGTFYEYLIKEYIRSSKVDKEALEMFTDAISKLDENGLFQKDMSNKWLYVSTMSNKFKSKYMEHESCFAGGIFALASGHMRSNNFKQDMMALAIGITETCHNQHVLSRTHLAPEIFDFDQIQFVNIDSNFKSQNKDRFRYLLRAETAESYFYLWTIHKQPRYKLWAFELIQALETYCAVPGNGFAGIANVEQIPVEHLPIQNSWFLSETLKYLFLIFSSDNPSVPVSMEHWVFNTRGHPFLIYH